MAILKSQKRTNCKRIKKRRRVRRTAADKARDVEFATQYLESLLRDAKHCLPTYRSADFARDCAELRKRITSQGLPFVTDVLPKLIAGLFDQLEGRVATFDGFKCRENRPEFLRGLFCIASSDNVADKVMAIRYIYMVSVSFKKLKGTYKREKLAKQFDEFVEVDKNLPTREDISNNAEAVAILNLAMVLMGGILGDVDPNSQAFRPRPGPGATNRPVQKALRFRPQRLFSQIESVMSFWDGWYTVHPWDIPLQASYFLDLLKNIESEPVSRFKFVPKTSGKARGICIEENEVQFLQQAVRRGVTNAIESDAYLSSHIALNDQTVNANLALMSSIDRSYATIDMSEASDRIPRWIVEYLTEHLEIGPMLSALSTRWVKPPPEAHSKDLIRTNKFAPMGSALCFPIMSLVHFVLIKAIIRLTCNASYDKADDIYVYGDDIIIPSDTYTSVTERLAWFGMKLNLTKSFVHSHFRESCGIHAYNGINITPVYIRCIPTYHSSKAHLQTHFATEQQLHEGGFACAAACYRSWIKQCYGRDFPTVPRSSQLVGYLRKDVSLTDLVWNSKARWDQDTQQPMFKLEVFKTRTETSRVPQYQSYLRWHCMHPKVDSCLDLKAKGPASRYGTVDMSEQTAEMRDALPGVILTKKWVLASACGATAP